MTGGVIVFSRKYRAALLDYLLGSGETGCERAYELGRSAIGTSLGMLQILRVHQQALSAILKSTGTPEEGLRRLTASQEFLMEALSPFEMACRGYLDVIGQRDVPVRPPRVGQRNSPSNP